MGPKIKAVVDSGPLIHLNEIGAVAALSIFDCVSPPAVQEEVRQIPNFVKIKSGFETDLVQILQNEFALGLGESECIALAKTEKIPLFLTDDLDARTTAEQFDLEPHGTVGILLKAYKKKIFSKKQTVEYVQKLKTHSTLYITTDLIRFILDELQKN
ncbi:MAG: hypothetical protein V1777_02700 [Candidatus Micrarchaeota archaeon]